jgi:hypothetical protein
VAFDRGERLFGSDADQMLIRKPDTAYAHFREMLGRSADHPLSKNVEAMRYGTQPYMNATRGGQNYAYTYKGEPGIDSFSAEELSAMVFSYARDITKDFGGIAVRDAVITVPSFATAHERRALAAAADIAGLKVSERDRLKCRGLDNNPDRLGLHLLCTHAHSIQTQTQPNTAHTSLGMRAGAIHRAPAPTHATGAPRSPFQGLRTARPHGQSGKGAGADVRISAAEDSTRFGGGRQRPVPRCSCFTAGLLAVTARSSPRRSIFQPSGREPAYGNEALGNNHGAENFL